MTFSDNASLKFRLGRCKVCGSIFKTKSPKRRMCSACSDTNMRRRAKMLTEKYNLSLDDYQRMFDEQGGVCAICKDASRADDILAVDHCHKTGAVRGLLCSLCNTGIGMFCDDATIIQSAAMYLKKEASHDIFA